MIAASGGEPPTPPEPGTYTIVLHPSSYDDVNIAVNSGDNATNIAKGYAAADSTTYAQFSMVPGENAETYFYYKFDTSQIPANATIDSVECTALTYISGGGSNIPTRKWQLATGTTPKGNEITMSSPASASTVSGESWTRAEVADIGILLYAQRGSQNTGNTYNIRFYGADLTITYTA